MARRRQAVQRMRHGLRFGARLARALRRGFAGALRREDLGATPRAVLRADPVRASERRFPAGVTAGLPTAIDSRRAARFLPLKPPAGWPLDIAQHLHLGLQQHPEALVHAAASL